MLIAGNNVGEYNEIMKMSVEDFLIRFRLYINEIEEIQKANQNK